MREQYIKQVKKELAVSRKLKNEVLRDLNEAFDSATEHGEAEEQVINRLGTPRDFAENIEETAGFQSGAISEKEKKAHLDLLFMRYCNFLFRCRFDIQKFRTP